MEKEIQQYVQEVGGCTHIATNPANTLAEVGAANLSEVLIVAGGSGGGARSTMTDGAYASGGRGGGLKGGNATNGANWPAQRAYRCYAKQWSILWKWRIWCCRWRWRLIWRLIY